MADHRQIALARPAAMNVAITPAHRAEGRAKIGSGSVQQGFAESQSPRLIANQRRENISLAERDGDGDAQGFLPAPDEDAAMDFARAIKAGEFLIQNAPQKHPAKRADVLLTRGCGGFECYSAA